MFSGRFGAFLFTFLLFMAQNALNYLFPAQVPSLLLIAVVYYSLSEGPRFGMVLGLFAGSLMELFGQGGLGFYMAQLAGVGLLSGFASSKIFRDSLLTEILLPALAAYCAMLAEAVYVRTLSGEGAGWGCLLEAFRPWVLAGTALTAPFLFSRLERATAGNRRAWRR